MLAGPGHLASALSHSSIQARRLGVDLFRREEQRLFRLHQRVEGGGQRCRGRRGRQHPVAGGDLVLEARRHHEGEELPRQLLLGRGLDQSRHLDLQIVALLESRRLVARAVLGNRVIGGRGRVGEDHRRLALGEEGIGLRPAGRCGEDALRELGPGLARLVAIDRLHPQQEAEAGRRAARILQDDLLRRIAVDEIVERCGRVLHRLAVVDHREMRVVEGHEELVAPCHGHLRQGRVESVRAEEAGGRGFGGEVGVEAQDDIGLGRGTFQLQAVQHGHAIAQGDPVDAAVAIRLESRLDAGARAPLGDEAVIGIDGQRLFRSGGYGRKGQRQDGCEDCLHRSTSMRRQMEDWTQDIGVRSQSLRRHDPDQVQRVEAESPSQPVVWHPVESSERSMSARMRLQAAFARKAP